MAAQRCCGTMLNTVVLACYIRLTKQWNARLIDLQQSTDLPYSTNTWKCFCSLLNIGMCIEIPREDLESILWWNAAYCSPLSCTKIKTSAQIKGSARQTTRKHLSAHHHMDKTSQQLSIFLRSPIHLKGTLVWLVCSGGNSSQPKQQCTERSRLWKTIVA